MSCFNRLYDDPNNIVFLSTSLKAQKMKKTAVGFAVKMLCTNELKNLAEDFVVEKLDSNPHVLLDCLKSVRTFNALRCFPTMQSSVGFSIGIEADVKPTGEDQCGFNEVAEVIKIHPAVVKKAVETLLPSFRGRMYNTFRGSSHNVGAFVSNKLFQTSLPKICGDVNKEGICWLFSRCVKIQSRLLQSNLNQGKKVSLGVCPTS